MLQALLVALLVGFAVQALGRQGEPILRGITHLQRLVFRVLAMIMWLAPIGAFGAIAAVVGETGVDALKSLGQIMVGLLPDLRDLRLRGAGHDAAGGRRREHLQPVALPGPGVPADRVHLVVGVRAAAADRQDGAPRRVRPVVGITVPTGYSFNLDGTAIYLTMASLFIADALGKPLSIGEQISLLLFMMIASKGAAGVTGAGPGDPGRRPAVAPPRPGRRRRPDRRHRPVHVRGPGADQLRRQRGGDRADRHLDRRVRPGPGQGRTGRRGPVRRVDDARRGRQTGSSGYRQPRARVAW